MTGLDGNGTFGTCGLYAWMVHPTALNRTLLDKSKHPKKLQVVCAVHLDTCLSRLGFHTYLQDICTANAQWPTMPVMCVPHSQP